MKIVVFVLSFFLLSISGLLRQEGHAEAKGSLYGLVVIIDPGHGGRDPGASGSFSGPKGKTVTVYEDEYVYDVACRLRRIAQANGAVVVMTVWDTKRRCAIVSAPQNEAIALNRDEEFVWDGTQVRAGQDGLEKRTAYANKTLRTYPKHRVVFLSLHFDATGNTELQGVHFVAPSGTQPQIVDLLVDEFREAKRLRHLDGEEYHPVTTSGDETSGTRSLFILSSKKNSVRQRVLIELGNFTNASDVWRIRSYEVREEYAQITLRALERLNDLPVKQVRK
jgi:N-acetylmuramoyl-L-alanine amidase